jgi:hypothetical protein
MDQDEPALERRAGFIRRQGINNQDEEREKKEKVFKAKPKSE